MQGLLQEINEIPQRARECYEKNKALKLPENVPYLGMGSSYFAPLTAYYAGAKIQPEIASEYYYYLASPIKKQGVLISQSGESSETVWNLDSFEEITAVINDSRSTLATHSKTKQAVEIYAGQEDYSSTKTYLNTLITLFLGHQIDPQPAIVILEKDFKKIAAEAQEIAEAIYAYLKNNAVKGLFVIGSGPNIGTAYEGALTLSETTKLSWQGTTVAQYDHGPKETAQDTIVLVLNANGKDAKRIGILQDLLKKNTNALFLELKESKLPESISSLALITKLNWIMNFLADKLKITQTFALGSKISRVSKETQ